VDLLALALGRDGSREGTAVALEIGGHPPARAGAGAVRLLQVVLVHLLHVGEHAPALAVDHDVHESCLRHPCVPTAEVGVQDLAQQRRVGVAVEQVERLVALQPLIAVEEVGRDVER